MDNSAPLGANAKFVGKFASAAALACGQYSVVLGRCRAVVVVVVVRWVVAGTQQGERQARLACGELGTTALSRLSSETRRGLDRLGVGATRLGCAGCAGLTGRRRERN